MEIRNAKEGDLNSLVDLFDKYRKFYGKTSDVIGANDFLWERLHKKDSEIYVCEHNGELTGFVQLYPLFSSTRMSKYWLLNDLFVDEKYRGKGISIELIDRAKQLVRESQACGMYLETEKTNVIGNNLYPRAGFKLYDGSNFYEWEVDSL
ncbi:MAG: GNAT family N-acetyltransferase [Bacteroidota bacterium]